MNQILGIQIPPIFLLLTFWTVSIIGNFQMARSRRRNIYFWALAGCMFPGTSTFILMLLKSKGTASGSRGILDRVLHSWIFDDSPSYCPSCRTELAKKPQRKTTCSFCQNSIYVRTDSSGYTELLNEGDLRFYKK